jgi:hypothetical protein
MNNANTSILESKLKRHKIVHTNQNGTIIIGKPKTDYLTLIGLVAFPIIAAIGISTLLIQDNFEFIGGNIRKIIAVIVLLFGAGIFNFSRVKSKKQSNENLKILDQNVIKVESEIGKYTFDSKSIKEFEYSVIQISEEIYEGNLYLIDTSNRKHQILGFDDDNEKYVLNDLKWFSEYLTKHTELNMTLARIVVPKI